MSPTCSHACPCAGKTTSNMPSGKKQWAHEAKTVDTHNPTQPLPHSYANGAAAAAQAPNKTTHLQDAHILLCMLTSEDTSKRLLSAHCLEPCRAVHGWASQSTPHLLYHDASHVKSCREANPMQACLCDAHPKAIADAIGGSHGHPPANDHSNGTHQNLCTTQCCTNEAKGSKAQG